MIEIKPGKAAIKLTRKEAAVYCGVSPQTITRWADDGFILAERGYGPAHVFDKEVLDTHLSQRGASEVGVTRKD